MRRRTRRLTVVVATVGLAAAACSDPEPAALPVVTPVPDTTAPAAGDSSSRGRDGAPGSVPGGDDAGPADVRSVTIEIEGLGFDDTVEVAIDPSDLVDVDPFGRFAACSGTNRAFGVYSVLVSTLDGPVRSVSLLTVDRVAGPGVHDADVRVEGATGEPVAAVGTVTIGDDLRSGSFVAFDAAGESMSGSFRCAGPDTSPVPLATGAGGVFGDSVSVFVLLRHERAERILGVAAAGSDPGLDVRCPGASGSQSDLLVRIDGDLSVGAMSTFELGDGASRSMRIRAGGATFEFAEVAVEVDPARASGTFSAVGADGVTADGAFACT